jgi:hypothetical protein
VKKLNHKILGKRKRKIEKRLERRNWENQERRMFKGVNICYEMDDRHIRGLPAVESVRSI